MTRSMSLLHELLLHWYNILHFQYYLFAECETIGSYSVHDCSWGLKEEANDGPAYYNATFWLWGTKGELKLVWLASCVCSCPVGYIVASCVCSSPSSYSVASGACSCPSYYSVASCACSCPSCYSVASRVCSCPSCYSVARCLQLS
jgi:hypothetical protein